MIHVRSRQGGDSSTNLMRTMKYGRSFSTSGISCSNRSFGAATRSRFRMITRALNTIPLECSLPILFDSVRDLSWHFGEADFAVVRSIIQANHLPGMGIVVRSPRIKPGSKNSDESRHKEITNQGDIEDHGHSSCYQWGDED